MDADLAAQEKARALLSWHQLPSPEHDTSGASVAVQHPRWWLNDGDVIISVGRQAGEREHRVLFKLHKDVLCRHLKPFHDMLSEDSAVPEAGKVDREPVILWETENAVQWSLISTIWNRRQEFGVEPVLVEDIENLLEMSVQMQCIRFREAAVSMISTIYPVTLYMVTDFALKYKLPEVLPSARLTLAKRTPRQLFEGYCDQDGQTLKLPRHELLRILRGRERLLKIRRDEVFKFLRPHRNFRYGWKPNSRCEGVKTARGCACSVWLQRWAEDWEAHSNEVYVPRRTLNILDGHARDRMRGLLCAPCWRHIKADMLHGQRNVWRQLPEIFAWAIEQERKQGKRAPVAQKDSKKPRGQPFKRWWSDSENEQAEAREDSDEDDVRA